MGHPVVMWFEECCTREEGAWCTSREAYESFEAWSADKGFVVGSSQWFLVRLRSGVPGLGKRIVVVDGVRQRCYTGFRLRRREELSNV